MPVDTTCSLVPLVAHLAATRQLQLGECSLAVASGVVI